MDDPTVLGPPYSKAQRQTLFAASGGVCANCRKPLASIDEAHADHKVPRALGGQTTLINGQILCPECNLKKGTSMNILHANREWHIRCLAAIETAQQNGAKDFVVDVPPASGKTRLGLELAYQMRLAGQIDFIIIAGPSTEIRDQWADGADQYRNPRPDRDPTRQRMRLALAFEANSWTSASTAPPSPTNGWRNGRRF